VSHDVDPQSCDLRLTAAKVNGKSFGEMLERQGGDGDHLGVELCEGRFEAIEIGGIR
jgi:hypothetical protein